MRSIRTLTLATLTALAFAPAAFAQDTTTTDTASGKHFAVVGGVSLLQPKNDPLDGVRKVDGGPAPTLSFSYYINDNWAVELWGAAYKFDHRVRGTDGARLGTVEQQPIALSGQYHFGAPDKVIRPFVGLGYYESNFSNETIGSDGLHVGLDTAKGAIATAGVDFNINSRWFARADARYMKGDSEMRIAGQDTNEELTMDPWTVGVGVGLRF